MSACTMLSPRCASTPVHRHRRSRRQAFRVCAADQTREQFAVATAEIQHRCALRYPVVTTSKSGEWRRPRGSLRTGAAARYCGWHQEGIAPFHRFNLRRSAHVMPIGEQGAHDLRSECGREKRQSLVKAAMKNFAALLANAVEVAAKIFAGSKWQ